MRLPSRPKPDGTPFPNPRDEQFYLRYLVTCAALGVKPVSQEKALVLRARPSDRCDDRWR